MHPDAEDSRSLALKLQELHETLTPHEQLILQSIVYTAADPVARAGMQDPHEILSEDEAALVKRLLRTHSETRAGNRTGADQ